MGSAAVVNVGLKTVGAGKQHLVKIIGQYYLVVEIDNGYLQRSLCFIPVLQPSDIPAAAVSSSGIGVGYGAIIFKLENTTFAKRQIITAPKSKAVNIRNAPAAYYAPVVRS